MRLDRALAEEESGGYLSVRAALGDERGDSALCVRQPFGALAASDPAELGARLVDPGRCP
jgi:hypothetical protein